MKIVKAEILHIQTGIAFTSVKGTHVLPWKPIILKLYTDEGIYGLGEVALAYGSASNAGAGILKDFVPGIIGMDPFDTEAIFNKLMKKTFWGQGGGTVIFGGMSAIDMACWDIKGKALNVPVYKLLGGSCRKDLRCYASQIQSDWGKERRALSDTEDYREAALKAVAEGYDAVKVDLFQYDKNGVMWAYNLCGCLEAEFIDMCVERMEAVRNAVGPRVDIIVENHAATDAGTSIQLAKAIEPYGVMYYEEPNTPLNPKVAKQIKEKINIPLAGGERIYSRWGYAPFFEDRSLDVIQPDLGTCGGLSEAKKIADMAHVYDIAVQAHACGSPVVNAACLHLEMALPNFIIHEHHRNMLTDPNIELCVYDYQPVNGRYTVPDLPGLGQDLTSRAYELADICTIE